MTAIRSMHDAMIDALKSSGLAPDMQHVIATDVQERVAEYLASLTDDGALLLATSWAATLLALMKPGTPQHARVERAMQELTLD